MKSHIAFAMAAGTILIATCEVQAQARRYVRPPIAKYQPYTSPALNLLSPGGSAFGYLTGMEPQEQFRQSEYSFRRNLNDFEQRVDKSFQKLNGSTGSAGIQSTISTTGHRTSFMNYGNYFPANAAGR